MRIALKSGKVLAISLLFLCSGNILSAAPETPAAKNPPLSTPKKVLSEDEKALNVFLERGFNCKINGNYSEADSYLRQALAVAEKMGKKDKRLAITLNLIAGNCRYLGNYAESEKMYIRAIQIQKALNSPPQEVATVMDNLAQIYSMQHKLDQAEEIHKEALGLYEKSIGKDNLDYALALANLANLYREKKDLSKAELYLNQALAIMEKLYGKNKVEVALSIDNLGSVYMDQGKYKEAEAKRKEALAIFERVLPEGHPDWGICLNNLASAYTTQGRFQEAQKCLERSLSGMSKFLGKDHKMVRETVRQLADLQSRVAGFADSASKTKDGSQLSAESVLTIIEKYSANPTYDPEKVSKIVGQYILKAMSREGFYYTSRNPQNAFEAVNINLSGGLSRSGKPNVLLVLNSKIEINVEEIRKRFGKADSEEETPKLMKLNYNKDWGTILFGFDPNSKRLEMILYEWR